MERHLHALHSLTPYRGFMTPTPSTVARPLSSGAEHSTPSTEEQNITRTRRKPIPRKGHTKSRKGCLTCKQRKVKCPEDFPECRTCQRIGLACQWPQVPERRKRRPSTSPSPSPSGPLQTTPKAFSMEDLRFFQHFIFHAYPPLPLGGEMIWRDLVTISHSFDFLIHAMLGVAASHLSLSSPGDYAKSALAHRVAAIQALNLALSKPVDSAAETDARFATVFILVYQSSYMPDGMYDFITMLRGCYLVADVHISEGDRSSKYGGKFHFHTHKAAIMSLDSDEKHNEHALLDRTLVDGFSDSMDRLALLVTSPAEYKYCSAIKDTLTRTTGSAVDAFTRLGALYILFGSASAAEFRMLADSSNHVSQLLLAHLFLVESVIQASAVKPINGATPSRKEITATWVRAIAQRLPKQYEDYIRWPMEVVELMRSDDRWLVAGAREMKVPEQWTRMMLIDGRPHRVGLRQQWKVMIEKAEDRGLLVHAPLKPNITAVLPTEGAECLNPAASLVRETIQHSFG